jgi:pimeloyl-ACP methyl ester carboxylesterase
MKYFIYSFIAVTFLFTSCQKEKITIGTGVSESFYVENNGASMRVLVEGNTASSAFILFVHGGPGTSAYFYNTDYIKNNLGDKYALVFWDERNAGASQGNINGTNLTLTQMTDDLKKVIQVLKYRYGQSSEVFLLGHSFGGLLTSSFMTTDDNESMIQGWIFADGTQNYPLNDSLTREMLLTSGQQQIALNKNKAKWEEIISYCNLHTGNFSFDESNQLEDYAETAETYFDEVTKVDYLKLFGQDAIKKNWPLTSILVNYLYSSAAEINKEIVKVEFSSSLYKVSVPVLILFGQYDFVCPKGLGDNLYKNISSTDKKIVISPISGHEIMLQDEVLFCNEIDEFVKLHRLIPI